MARLCLVALTVLVASPLPAELEITYVANEGFLLAGGGKKVLIDALFDGGIAGYPTIPDELRPSLEQARPPFDGVDLVLATHFHGDHFGPPNGVELADPDQPEPDVGLLADRRPDEAHAVFGNLGAERLEVDRQRSLRAVVAAAVVVDAVAVVALLARVEDPVAAEGQDAVVAAAVEVVGVARPTARSCPGPRGPGPSRPRGASS